MIFFTRTHLEQALTVEQLRINAVIRIALMMGIIFFYLTIFAIFSIRTSNSYSAPNTELMNLLSFVHLIFSGLVIVAAFRISKLPLRKERLDFISKPEEAAAIAISLYLKSSILLLAPIEGAAFFGGAVCIVGVTNGTMALEPLYWLNAVSAALLLLIGIVTFPTRERILSTLENSFLRT